MENNKEKQLNLIDRFLHITTEPFDDWDWDGRELIVFNNENVENYSISDFKELLIGF